MIPPRKSQINRSLLQGPRWSWRLEFLRAGKLRSQFRRLVSFVELMLLPCIRANQSLKQLQRLSGAPGRVKSKGIVAVAAHYGNHGLVDSFIAHHRQLGVKTFVFLDLSEDGGLSRHLVGSPDHTVWRPRDMAAKELATHWLNALRARYASGHWCLSLDTSDAFVFYRSETRKLADLIEFLESECRDHVFAVVVDMYGDGPAEDLKGSEIASSPRDALAYFDPFGFVSSEKGPHRDVVVRGGPQRRTLFRTKPNQSPALNRIPLVRWRWYYAYLAGTKLMMPMHLNNPHAPWHSTPTGCILRFALLNDASTLKAATAWEKQNVIHDPSASYYEGLSRLRQTTLKQAFSQRYSSTRDLVDCGLLNPGQWF